MNLRFKMTKKLTAVAQFINDSQCLFSDECSPHSEDTLQLLETEDGFEVLVDMAKELARELAGHTRFKPVIALIKGKHLKVEELEPLEGEADKDDPFDF